MIHTEAVAALKEFVQNHENHIENLNQRIERLRRDEENYVKQIGETRMRIQSLQQSIAELESFCEVSSDIAPRTSETTK